MGSAQLGARGATADAKRARGRGSRWHKGSAQLWARGASGGERSPARESKVYGSGLGRRGHTSNVCAERGATENVSTECPVTRLRVLAF